MADAKAFDEELNEIEEAITHHRALNKLKDIEKRNLAIYLREIFVANASKEWKEQTKHWVKHQMRSWTSKIAIKGSLRVMKWFIKNTNYAIQDLQKEVSSVQKRLKTSKEISHSSNHTRLFSASSSVNYLWKLFRKLLEH